MKGQVFLIEKFPIGILILMRFLLESAHVYVELEKYELWAVKIYDQFQGPDFVFKFWKLMLLTLRLCRW